DTQQESGLSRTGQALGTPAYMAPEQAEGKARLVGPRSDVYSLGAILYEMLAGRPPFVGENALQVMRAALHEEPVPPRVFTPGVPRDLETICLKCLEKEGGRRYASAAEFADELKAFQHDEPISARPISAAERAWKKVRKNPAPYVVGAVAILVIVVGTAAFMWSLDQKRREAEHERGNAVDQKLIAEQREAEAQRQKEQAEKARKDAETRQAESLAAQGDALGLASRWQEAEARYKEAYDILARLSLPTMPADLGMLDRYRNSPVSLHSFHAQRGEEVLCVAVFPDNRSVLSGGSMGTLQLWDVMTGRAMRRFTGHTRAVNSVAISRDGRLALSGSTDKTMRLWDVITGQEVRSFGPQAYPVLGVALSPDGELALGGGGIAEPDKAQTPTALKIWSVPTGHELRSLRGHKQYVGAVAFSPDGKLALSGGSDRVVVWNVEAGQMLRSSDCGQLPLSVAFAPDGCLALTGAMGGQLQLMSVGDGSKIRTFAGHRHSVSSVAFSPDGRSVLSGGGDGTLKLWDVGTGRELCSYAGHAGYVTGVAYSTDGRLAFSASRDGTLKLWPITGGREARSVRTAFSATAHTALSPDGTVIAYRGRGPRLRVLDVATGRELPSPAAQDNPQDQGNFAFSPDGKWILHPGNGNCLDVSELGAGRRMRSIPTGEPVLSVAYSPDGKTALTGGRNGALRLWEVEAWRETRRLRGHKGSVWRVAYSPRGNRALSKSDDGALKLWDLDAGREIWSKETSPGVWGGIALSPDGSLALSGSNDGVISLWHVDTGEKVRSFTGHTNIVHSLMFAPDTQTALSGSWDCTLKVWDVATGREIHTFTGHTAGLAAVALTPDAKVAVSSSRDSTIMFWDLACAQRYRDFMPCVDAAIKTLQEKPEDAAALATLAEWYYFRNFPDWAAELWERARAVGAKVSPLELARAYWLSGKPAEAKREFQKALEAKEAPECYLRLCLAGVPMSLYDRAQEDLAKGDCDQAIAALQRLIEYDKGTEAAQKADAQIGAINHPLQPAEFEIHCSQNSVLRWKRVGLGCFEEMDPEGVLRRFIVIGREEQRGWKGTIVFDASRDVEDLVPDKDNPAAKAGNRWRPSTKWNVLGEMRNAK
ncbi:MAG: hypothetical protein NTW87_02940, partial [Planctomycetota bacterium]|nr:hypothetical protein [Planctomycetota bacterium]